MTAPDNDKPESGLWKDYINRKMVARMAAEIGRVHKEFDQSSFVAAVIDDSFLSLELKQRITAALKGELLFTPNVALVEPDSLPKSEGKAVRVIDHRRKE